MEEGSLVRLRPNLNIFKYKDNAMHGRKKQNIVQSKHCTNGETW